MKEMHNKAYKDDMRMLKVLRECNG